MFPVNEAGRETKSTDDLPVVQPLQTERNELCIISVPLEKQSSSLESVVLFSLKKWSIKTGL